MRRRAIPIISNSSKSSLTLRSRNERRCRGWSRSRDGGATWSAVAYEPGTAAYSDLAETSDGQVLCLYEADRYGCLRLARFAKSATTRWSAPVSALPMSRGPEPGKVGFAYTFGYIHAALQAVEES